MVGRFLLMFVCAAAAVAPARAQAPAASFARYTAIVEAYRGGSSSAVTEIAAWPGGEVEQMLGPAAAAGVPFAEAAAMLHTEVAVAAVPGDWERGAVHLAAAEALVQSLPASAEAFVERYYAFGPTIFLARGNPDEARAWIDRGLKLFEFSAPIRTVSGMVDELFAHLADPECAGRECASGGANSLGALRLGAAEREYRMALEREADFSEAHLRLGRVLALQGRDGEADSQLAAAAANGTTRARYLAHLFRADVALHRGDVAAARREYEAAGSELPGCQTPYLALSHLEEGIGNAMRARQIVAQLVALGDRAAADPWWGYQNGAVDTDMLQWLVAYVRR